MSLPLEIHLAILRIERPDDLWNPKRRQDLQTCESRSLERYHNFVSVGIVQQQEEFGEIEDGLATRIHLMALRHGPYSLFKCMQ
mmetsp:Transcript_46529/g.71160  ORF Transcript_46529/g.71160 Transcript_46529/m.71160 type:complete len:84 (-) Transcript_46529:48-299(-)